LAKLKLKNFRCYQRPTEIEFDDLTAIVGRNDVGKSTILEALDIFLADRAIEQADASIDGDKENVEITCEFDDFPETIVIDTTHKTTLAAEYLLNERQRLEIAMRFNCSLATQKRTAVIARALHPGDEPYRNLLLLKRAELIALADRLRVDLTGVARTTNAPIRAAIWRSRQDHALRECEINLDKEDAKQIWANIEAALPTYALFKSDRISSDQDAEAQDPLKSAIKDALKELQPTLLEIQRRVEAEVGKIAADTVRKLCEMDPQLAATLSPIVSTKKWETVFQTSITGDQGIPLNKRGSGTKRLVLLNFFRAKAERDALKKNGSSVIYAIEEPETSQHPRNQRILISALNTIAASPGNQIILTTHTPMLARAIDDKSIRYIHQIDQRPREVINGGDRAKGLAIQALGILPDNSVKLFIGVEGKHDLAFLKTVSGILGAQDPEIPNLEKLEVEGELIFFPFSGSNLLLWGSRLQHLNRPEFHICDRDDQPPSPPKYQAHIDQVNARTGCYAVSTNKREMENYLHPLAIIEAYQANGLTVQLPEKFGEFEDVPETVARAVHLASGADRAWDDIDEKLKAKKMSSAKAVLNNQAAAKMTLGRFEQTDAHSEVRQWFIRIGEMLRAI
jgi:putative ATP-dependent endonuclease of OLD family